MAKPEGPKAPPIPEGAQEPPAPQAPQVLQAPQESIPCMPPFNWSHFKPKFSVKPDEDAEAHLLRKMIGWTLIDFRKMIKFTDFV